jgi:GTP cyclohydrolase I
MASNRGAAARAIDDFLRAIGRDPSKEPELEGTGARVADAFIDELCAGYEADVDAMLAANVIEEAQASNVVLVRGMTVTTMCPHHLMAGVGTAVVAYQPTTKIIGVGAVPRVLDALARRLVLQERIGEDMVAALERHLTPRWCVCRIAMSHACMTARGARAHGAELVTIAVRAQSDAARTEALAHVRGVGDSV